MRNARRLGVAVAASFVLSVLVVVAPSATSTSHSVAIDDAAGDVTLCVAGQAPCSASPNQEMVNYFDLTKVMFGRETSKNLTIEFTVAGMTTAPPTMASSIPTAYYLACFSFAGVSYGATAWVIHNAQSGTKTPMPGKLFVPDGDCSFATMAPPVGTAVGASPPVAEVALHHPTDVGIDAAKGTLWMRIQRKDLADLHGLAGQDVRSPKPGDSLDDISAATRGAYRPVNQMVLEAEDRAGPGSAPFPFTVGTANELLEIRVKTNTVDRGLRVPEYSVDAGGFQAIPVEIVNRANEEKSVTLNATLKEGDAAKWTFSLVPVVKVPGLSDEGDEGLRVVTLVVQPQEGVAHLERAKVEVAAAFADQPDMAGSVEVEVKAIYPPTPENPKLWLHYGPVSGSTNARMWMNTLKDDPREWKGEQGVYTPVDQGSFLIYVDPDVQPSKDLILNAQADSVLNLNVSTSGEADVEWLAYLANGEDRTVTLGKGRVHFANGEVVPLALRLPVQPLSREDKEFRVEAGVGKGIRLRLSMDPSSVATSTPVGALPVGGSTPTVSLHVPGSSMALPIVRVEAPGLTNMSDKGARVSMHLLEEKDMHVNPGKTRALNFTVLNEGVYEDTVRVKLAFNQSQAWRVALLPTATFKLPPGEGENFALFVTPPMSAEEDSTLLMEVMAESKVDPTVVSKLRYEFIVTRGVELADEGGLAEGFKGKGAKKGGTPGFEAMAALAAVGAALLLARRRE